MDFSALEAGGPIPSVNPGDLRGVWELMHEMRTKFMGNRESELGGPQRAISFDFKLLAQVCSPEADVLAVWSRSTLLGILVERGLLTRFQRGTHLEDAVFNVAAAFPIPALDQFDPDAFLQQLSSRGA
jgi:hypothetical protein